MQVFKVFFQIMKSRVSSYGIYFIVFVIIAVMMSGEQAENKDKMQFKETSVTLAVIDYDQSQMSQAICDYIGEKHKVVKVGKSHDEVAEAFFYQRMQVVVEIPKGFQAAVLAAQETGEEPEEQIAVYKEETDISHIFVIMQLNQYISAYKNYVLTGLKEEEAMMKAKDIMGMETKVTFAAKEKEVTGSVLHYFFIYLPYIFICMFIVGMGGVFVSFRRTIIEQRTECASMPLLSRNLWLFSAAVLVSLLTYALFMLVGGCLYTDMFFTKQCAYYALNAIVFVPVAVSIMYLVSFVAKSASALNMAGNVLGLGMGFSSGIMVPMEYMSKEVLRFSKFLPTYWYVKAANLIDRHMDNPAWRSEYYFCLFIQILFAAAIFAAALCISRMKQKNS